MRRKLVLNIRYLLFCTAFSVVLTSCGLVEFDMNDEAQPVMSMTLDHDTVYVMQGDRFMLKPVRMFTIRKRKPESMSIKSRQHIYGRPDAPWSLWR